MGNFVSGVVQNIVADLLFLAAIAIVGWIIARRGSWRTLFSVFRLARNGVTNIYVKREEYISRRKMPLELYLGTTKRKLTYVGLYFSVATDQSRVDQSITDLINKGCIIEIVLLDEATPNEIVSYLENHLALAPNSLKARVKHGCDHFKELRQSLAPAKRNSLTVKLHKFPLTASAFLIDPGERDARMLVDVKWFGAGREKSTGIEFEGVRKAGSLFETIADSFTRIAAIATPVE